MAVLSDCDEEGNHPQSSQQQQQQQQIQSPKSFSATLDPSNPLGFLQSALEFVSVESDFLNNDSSEKDIISLVKKVKDKQREELEKKNNLLKEKKKKDEDEVPMEEDKDEKEKSKYRVPNKGNGLDLENYSWGQSLQEVTVNVPVPPGTKSRFILCEIKKNHLKVGLKGQPPIIDGELYKPVKPDDCFWSLEDQKAVSILLTKHDQMQWWKCVVKGEPEVDTQKVEPESSKLTDLDPETRSTVEKMMMVGTRGNGNSDAEAERLRLLETAVMTLLQNNNPRGREERTVFDRFDWHRPPTFNGVDDPVVLENWVREIEKLFIVNRVSDDQKVDIAAHYLKEKAHRWWAVFRDAHIAQPGYNWAGFKESLHARFYPEELRYMKQQEFMDLEQGSMSVQEYTDKFIELSHFATTIITNEIDRVRRYERRLTPRVRSFLAGMPSTTFQQAYNRALSVYASVQAEKAEEAKRNEFAKRSFAPDASYQNAQKKPKFEYRSPAYHTRCQPQENIYCYKCKKTYHPGKNCDGTAIDCFICKNLGHKSFDCPQKPKTATGTTTGAAPKAQNNGRIYIMSRSEAEGHPDVVAEGEEGFEGATFIAEEDL